MGFLICFWSGKSALPNLRDRYRKGFRHHSGLNNIKVTINGADAEVLFAGAQGGFVGLDQCNVRLATSLAGSGEISVALTADGKTSNTVKARIK